MGQPIEPSNHDHDGDDDPLRGLPPEIRALLEQLGGGASDPTAFAAMFAGGGMPGPVSGAGPVDWALAGRVAMELAEDGDREATEGEQRRITEAVALAEHWLDMTSLPAPADAGRVVVASRRHWATVALDTLRPLVEPIATASLNALVELAGEQLAGLELSEAIEESGMDLPPELAQLLERFSGGDISSMLRPAGAMLAGLQVGQVVGRLSQQLLGQYDLGIPTAPRPEATLIAVNVDEAFTGYGLDATEVAVVLAIDEAAHRRLYHAVTWLEGHVHGLVAEFAQGIEVDPARLEQLADELMTGIDPDDADGLREAMERAATFRLEPTVAQRHTLERLQAVVALTGAWARHEASRALGGRIPGHARIAEVLRRRRAVRGDGETLLATLLGLDIKPADESVAQRFVEHVSAAIGPSGLHRALAHPENLPEADELADPGRWLQRTTEVSDIPDDVTAMFAGLSDAPVEPSADQRTTARDDDPDDARDEDPEADPGDPPG